MPAAVADSAIYSRLFGDAEVARLFSDSAELRAMLLVEGALARVQGALGLIPAEAAAFIDRAAQEVQIDPSALAAETARNGVPVPAFLAAFRKAAMAPDPMQYLHWGATSQDIMDTALALRLRPMLALWEARLDGLTARLADLAESGADLPMAARTYGQFATPTSFGAVVAGWGWPVLDWRARMAALRGDVLKVSLSGAAGTLSAMGDAGPQVRADLARELGLTDPGRSWHSDRSAPGQLAGFAAGLAGSLGKLGEDVLALSQSGLGEVGFRGGSGASSTMPQKQNPVAASALVALARQVIGLAGLVQGAALHRQQRDGAAWFSEWLSLPQLCISTSRMLTLADEIAASLVPDAMAMARLLEDGLGLIHAEALSFALAGQMPRPDAMAAVKELCQEAQATQTPLTQLAGQRFPGTDWAERLATGGLGQAPVEAMAFVARVRTG
ncbi:MAG: lyase family protein [Pseudotabrizicola sp.]|uniref:lyase family protein n=1 Tax=Pseudotabrizicola sp. TaxID=2939647 RepID=UPI002720FCE5|nr:lyase family protein [Pseudotabrizicola sp.]MDO9638247.1 lyase family protein [Pseudotabrizicola sp.]